MRSMAFATSTPSLLPTGRSRAICTRNGVVPIRLRYVAPRCSSQQPPEGREIAPENEALQRELRAKVKELFGGAENVSIAVNGDSPEFTVRRAPDGSSPAEYRQAVATVVSIAVLSVVAGLLFAYLYTTGAVHGSPKPDHDVLSSPSSSRARYDPYTLLGRDVDTL